MESTKRAFYRLLGPSKGKPYLIHGRLEWESRFGRAEWSNNVGGLSTGRLLPPYGEPRVDLTIILPSLKLGDFVWTWYSDCIVTEGPLSLFKQAGLTGFEARPVTVEKIKRFSRKHNEEVAIPPLWELLIQGRGGDAAPESGIYPLYEIEDSGRFSYSSFRNGIVVDEANWDASDFFTVNGYPKFILVTERVKDLIIDRKLINCALIPSHKLEWGSDIRPEESLAKTRAIASRPLESLLADLASPDVSMDIIHALGHKGDPRAVDSLIREFGNPDPFIWYATAGAVAEIARNKNVPEKVREGILRKLSGLLDHDDPLVRRTAAAAFGYIGGKRAAEEVMRVFDDPYDLVRDRGVFVMGLLRYKPALEAVRGLTRDRSKTVRQTARRVLRELSAEFP
jgi:PBS lyase HEAT-like repeat